MIVGIFGYYDEKNFGDDLMAVIFGNYVSSEGYQCLIYGHKGLELHNSSFKTTQNFEEFCDKINVLIMGGGGYLVPNNKSNKFFDRIEILVEKCLNKSVPIYCISVGGIGESFSKTYVSVQKLILKSKRVTVRTDADLKILRQINDNVRFYQDVVWLTPKLFPQSITSSKTKTKKSKLRIGICLRKRRYRWPLMQAAIYLLVFFRKDCDFIFIDLTADKSRFRGIDLADKFPNCKRFWCNNIHSDLEFINTLDLVISSTLHLGMVATAFGIPNIGLFSDKKARLGFKMVNLLGLHYNLSNLIFFFWNMLSKKRTEKLLELPVTFDLNKTQANANKHFSTITEILDSGK